MSLSCARDREVLLIQSYPQKIVVGNSILEWLYDEQSPDFEQFKNYLTNLANGKNASYMYF